MATLWIALLFVLWCFVLVVGMLFLGVLRQLGVLHERIDTLTTGKVPPRIYEGLEIGTHAPDFTLSAIGGGTMSLKDFRGKRVLLAFIQPGCAPCKDLLPHLDALNDPEGASPLQVLIISTGDLEANEQMHFQHRLLSPLLLQEGWRVAETYKVARTPYIYVLDEQGNVRIHDVANKDEKLEQMLGYAREKGVRRQSLGEPTIVHDGSAGARASLG